MYPRIYDEVDTSLALFHHPTQSSKASSLFLKIKRNSETQSIQFDSQKDQHKPYSVLPTATAIISSWKTPLVMYRNILSLLRCSEGKTQSAIAVMLIVVLPRMLILKWCIDGHFMRSMRMRKMMIILEG